MKLDIRNLEVSIDGKKIIKGLSLSIKDKEVHAIMGPNGSGKSTLSYAMMGHPNYKSKGSIKFDGNEIIEMSADQRSKLGIFTAYQQAVEIEGLGMNHFLYTISNKKLDQFKSDLDNVKKTIKKSELLLDRDLNVGFSGGEKKKSEIIQLLILKPKLAILDEIDSGLDVDALKVIANAIDSLRKQGMAVIIITHNSRILNYIVPNMVHVMRDGKIVETGKKELVSRIEKEGFFPILSKTANQPIKSR